MSNTSPFGRFLATLTAIVVIGTVVSASMVNRDKADIAAQIAAPRPASVSPLALPVAQPAPLPASQSLPPVKFEPELSGTVTTEILGKQRTFHMTLRLTKAGDELGLESLIQQAIIRFENFDAAPNVTVEQFVAAELRIRQLTLVEFRELPLDLSAPRTFKEAALLGTVVPAQYESREPEPQQRAPLPEPAAPTPAAPLVPVQPVPRQQPETRYDWQPPASLASAQPAPAAPLPLVPEPEPQIRVLEPAVQAPAPVQQYVAQQYCYYYCCPRCGRYHLASAVQYVPQTVQPCARCGQYHAQAQAPCARCGRYHSTGTVQYVQYVQ